MAEIQHAQIKSKLTELIVPCVDKSDISQKTGPNREGLMLSRSVSIAALQVLTDIDADLASDCVVDGGKDNGIDAIYYDKNSRALYLVQAKWSNSHSGSISSGDVLKFLHGVQDLVSLKADKFNSKIKKRWNAIEDALNRLTSVRLVIAYPGSGGIDNEIQDRIDEFLVSQNDTSDLFFFNRISQRELFQYFVRQAAPPSIELTIRWPILELSKVLCMQFMVR